MGFIIFLTDKNGSSVPISWSSRKTKRVARSTLTAESLAAIEAVDNAILIKAAVEEVLGRHIPPICALVDNKSLAEVVKTTNVPAEKRLIIDLGALREMIEQKTLILEWVPTEKQLADVLTKQGASKEKLIRVLCRGSLQ